MPPVPDESTVVGGLPLLQYVERPGLLDLGWGHPHPAALPVAAWSSASAAALAEHGGSALSYGHGPGPGPLIRWLTERIGHTDARGATPAQTFITAGASHGLELISQVLTRPGDLVLVDSPTYHLALRVLADRRVDIVAAPTAGGGIDPAATADLVAAARRDGRRVPLLYLVPTFANPTGTSLADDRRGELVAVARRAGLTIVEDDTYRELIFDGVAPASLWSLAGAGEVIRIGSFAKTVGPGLRLGWVNAEPAMVDRLAGLGYVDSGGGVNHFVALVMAAFGASGAYDEQLIAARARYAAQRDALVSALERELPDQPVPAPAGGWFVWYPLPAPIRATELLTVADRHGVSFLPGTRFHVDGRGEDRVRLAYSMLGPAQLTEAARRLAGAVRELLERPAGIEPA
jgi:2-aminoadipate transaminase